LLRRHWHGLLSLATKDFLKELFFDDTAAYQQLANRQDGRDDMKEQTPYSLMTLAIAILFVAFWPRFYIGFLTMTRSRRACWKIHSSRGL